MKKFTVESLAKKIEADNEIFDKATNAEKRVIIAQDCLIRIDLGQIIPETGNFCGLRILENDNIKKTLDTVSTRVCSACAKGSLFMAYLGRVNNFTRYQLKDGNSEVGEPHIKLLEVFDLTQLALIEYAFEGKLHIDIGSNLEDLYFDSVCNFRSKVANDNDFEIKREDFDYYCHEMRFIDNSYSNIERYEDALLKAICNNIIENNGEFVL